MGNADSPRRVVGNARVGTPRDAVGIVIGMFDSLLFTNCALQRVTQKCIQLQLKMGKRTSRSDDDDDDDTAKDREAECRGTLRALNAQFAAWVARRATESPIVSWGKGCEDYLKHVEKIKVRSFVRCDVWIFARLFGVFSFLLNRRACVRACETRMRD